MFTRISGDLLENSWECYPFSVLRNVPEDFDEFFQEIQRNVREDSEQCSRRFWRIKRLPGMFEMISGNINLHLIRKIYLFLSNFTSNCNKTIEKSNYWAILLKETDFMLLIITCLLSLIAVFRDYSFLLITVGRGRGLEHVKSSCFTM